MKYHHHLTESAFEILCEVFLQNRSIDQSLEKAMKLQKKWGGRDRRFVSEVVFDSSRWLRRNWERLGHSWNDHQSIDSKTIKSSIAVKVFDLIGSYPDQLLSAWGTYQSPLPMKAEDFSLSDFVFRAGNESFGQNAQEVFSELNKEAPIFIWPNINKISFHQLTSALVRNEIDFIKLEGGVSLTDRKKLKELLKQLDGMVEIQDINSKQVIDKLDPRPGDKILDACAGKGGKTLRIAERIGKTGKVHALEIVPQKVEHTKRRSLRAGLHNVETSLSPDTLPEKWKSHFDRVLIDVPCTGVGVMRRHPERKYQKNDQSFQELLGLQKKLLEQYAYATKSHGVIVYSTCSFIPEENELQVNEFLSNHSDFELIEQNLFTPIQNNGDVLFYSILRRKD